jgi:type I restriction enzyme S subunit
MDKRFEQSIDSASNGWRKLPLNKLAGLIKDQWQPGAEKIPYIGLEHIAQQSLTLTGVGESTAVESNKFRFANGDILFGKLRPYFRKVVQVGFDGICSTDIWVVRALEGCDQRYLFYFLANPLFIERATKANTGTRMPRADWSFLQGTVWPVPPLPEQKAIAAVLSSLDDKIELLRKQNTTLEQVAQVIFNEWFMEFNFPGKDGKPYKANGGKMVDSELGPIPEGWEVRGLSSIAEFLNGLALQKFPRLNDRDVLPVVKIREMQSGITDQTDTCSSKMESKYIIDNGDVIFSWSGSLELVLWRFGRGALNQHLFRVSSKQFPKWFYFHWIAFHLSWFRQIAASKATTMGHIQRHHLDEARVFVPDPRTLSLADQILSPCVEKQIANNLQINALSKLRDTLLPKLMSGELRVGK